LMGCNGVHFASSRGIQSIPQSMLKSADIYGGTSDLSMSS
jgi:hypothetical protein